PARPVTGAKTSQRRVKTRRPNGSGRVDSNGGSVNRLVELTHASSWRTFLGGGTKIDGACIRVETLGPNTSEHIRTDFRPSFCQQTNRRLSRFAAMAAKRQMKSRTA